MQEQGYYVNLTDAKTRLVITENVYKFTDENIFNEMVNVMLELYSYMHRECGSFLKKSPCELKVQEEMDYKLSEGAFDY